MFARELQSTFGAGQASAIVGSVAQTFTAAGTTQAAAAAITCVKTFITTATEGQGAILPASMQPADEATVANSTAVDVYVYPPVGGQLNKGGANLPLLLAPQTGATFTCVDGTNWMVNR